MFDENMSWENYGKVWHIDHIIPLSCFDLVDYDQVKIACHYSNLQPLLVEQNLKKGANVKMSFTRINGTKHNN